MTSLKGLSLLCLLPKGYPPIKINALLDTEQQGRSGNEKSIADLVVEGRKGNKYIVEIERAIRPTHAQSLF